MAWQRALWSAWHTEAFHRMRRLPSLESLTARLARRPGKEQTVEQMYQQITVMQAMFEAIGQSKKVGHG